MLYHSLIFRASFGECFVSEASSSLHQHITSTRRCYSFKNKQISSSCNLGVYISYPLFLERPKQLVERRSKSGDVEPDVLLQPVVLHAQLPPLLMYGLRVSHRRVVLAVLLVERALLGGDAVLDVPQPHLLGLHAVEYHGRVLHVAPRHHLQHRRVGAEEEEVCEPGAVRAHQHVARVHHLGELLEPQVTARLHDHHLEPGGLHRRGDLRDVDELPVPATVDEHEPRLPFPRATIDAAGRVLVCLLVRDAKAVGRQREDVPDVHAEVQQRVVARRAGRVDAEVAVAAEADDDARVAADAGALVEVDDVVAGQVGEDEAVLVDEPRLEVGDEELDLAVVGAGGDEERDEHVAEVVPRVGREPVHGEHDGRDGVPGGALGRHQGLRGAQGLDRHLLDVLQVLAGLVLDSPLLAVGAALGCGRDIEDGAVAADGPGVAGDLADVVPGVGQVADGLGRGT
ncbi:unnamed protein product [Triticum turgidum subsp. durum]|uniref:Uncharacterized protein n=1 Tax=Triticum turgidum subsp. durum TaxID=4567 RepID=A0A9R0ZBS3_TRITD|nr:unnamed protein product [Triticum turgidum subsp. durum]